MDPLWILIPLTVFAALLALSWLGKAAHENPRGDFDSGFLFLLGKAYSALVHNLRVRGKRFIPEPEDITPDRPLIVVCNHTAGVDPILVQTAVPFFIRWMMAADMREPRLEWFWRWWRIIFVDRTRNDGLAVREAIRHLKAGGTLGIFPEGGIERPPQTLMRFQHGVGMLIKRSGARVLPITIDGTPQVDPAWSSLWRTSASVIHFHEPICYADSDLSSREIVDDLLEKFKVYTGWEAIDSEAALDFTEGTPSYGRPVRKREG